MEAPMKRGHFIGMDTHCQFCEIAVVNHSGALVRRDRCATCIPDLLKIIEQVPRPRSLVIEEGPLAGWLWRNLHEAMDRLVVSEPRRNRLIAKDGDKDDDLDAEKLAQLLRGGYVKTVHQVQTLERALLKQYVSLYYHRVRQRVREALRISSLFRQHGVMIRENAFVAAEDRPALQARLPAAASFQEILPLLWSSYDAAVEHEDHWRRRLVRLAKQEEVIQRFTALPGISYLMRNSETRSRGNAAISAARFGSMGDSPKVKSE